MRFVVDRHQPVDGDVRIALRRRQARMAEQLLDRAEVGTCIEQMRRIRMAKRVWMEVGPSRTKRSIATHHVLNLPHR